MDNQIRDISYALKFIQCFRLMKFKLFKYTKVGRIAFLFNTQILVVTISLVSPSSHIYQQKLSGMVTL